MFYLFHGSDELAVSEAVGLLRRKLAEVDPMAELNYTELDGRRLAVADVQLAADAAPFMGDRRLVVVRGLVGRCNVQGGAKSGAASGGGTSGGGSAQGGEKGGQGGGQGGRKELVEALKAYLPQMAPTTRLVLWEGKLDANNPILKWAVQWRSEQPKPDEAAVVKSFEAPKLAQMPRWLMTRAQVRGGTFSPPAAEALADALARDGEVDARLADSELVKLLTYAGQRPVTAEDVAYLVTPVSLDSIFKLMDALGDRNGPKATTLLHQFLANNEHPLRILALVVRQIRLLLQTRALLDAGVSGPGLESRLPVAPFIARKLAGQARRFSTAFLEAALRRLLEIDSQIKTGRIDGVLALDLFVVGVCAQSGTAVR